MVLSNSIVMSSRNEPQDATSSSTSVSPLTPLTPLTPLHMRTESSSIGDGHGHEHGHEHDHERTRTAEEHCAATRRNKKKRLDSNDSNSNSKRNNRLSSSSSSSTCTFSLKNRHPSLVAVTLTLLIVPIVQVLIGVMNLPVTQAIAIKNGGRNNPHVTNPNANSNPMNQKLSTSLPPSVSTSVSPSNALALLNEARQLREQQQQQQQQQQKQPQQDQQDQPEYPSLALKELLRRTQENANKQRSATTTPTTTTTATWTTALFDDESASAIMESSEESYITNQVEKQLPSVKSLLRTSIGNDVPDMELHLQMEAARARGKECSSVAALAFMELYCNGASASTSTSTNISGSGSESISRATGKAHNGRVNSAKIAQGSWGSASGRKNVSSAGINIGTGGTAIPMPMDNRISAVEKVAMSTLPSQLPGLAAPVMNASGGRGRGRRRTQTHTQVEKRQGEGQQSGSTTTFTSMRATATAGAVAEPPTVMKNARRRSVRSSVNSGGGGSSDGADGRDASDGGKRKQFSKKGTAGKDTVKKIRTKEVSTIMTARKQLSKVATNANANINAKTKSATQRKASSDTDRVSHDEEIHLARIIQRGAELHSIKTKFEQKHMRDITRQEWTELAKLDNPKDLRRLVSDYRRAKSKLVMANMGLVHAVVRTRMRESGRGSVSFDGISYEELVQEGSLGLLRAAELFDPKRGLRFSTYATIWIKGVLGNNSLSEAITLPLREKNKWKKIQDSIEEISATKAVDEDGRDYKPSEEEIGSHCGLTPTEVKSVMTKMKRAKNVLSLDYQYDSSSRSGTESGKFDALANDKNLMDDVDLVEKLQLRADVVAAMTKNLDQREARLMRLRYGLNDGKTRSIRDCAEAMGISRARAQQLAAGCLKKLREADDAESLQEYLLSVA